MDKRGDRRMKVIVKFPYNVSGEYTKDIINRQEKQGFINVVKQDDWWYLVDEKGIFPFTVFKEWIERMIDDESNS
jgi:uncharacterized protein YneR